ncbi:MAG: dihydrolipoyl dehydrogenase [Acidiferrobacteraceae bacterium]|nr:dihydrolipoyl dehydrogenase [Acidiferrobacteraceae bacterium]
MLEVDLAVIGSGPGGYTAAFRAADLGLKVIIIEKHNELGGTCLNVGCIPSKTFLHTARVIDETKEISKTGVCFDPPTIQLDRLRGWKCHVIAQLNSGLDTLAKKRKVEVIVGSARFDSKHQIIVTRSGEELTINFQYALIATGSKPISMPNMISDERIIYSKQALELIDIPKQLLVIGGGIIGTELATVYQSLGSQVTIVEALNQLMAGVDDDLTKPLQKVLQQKCRDIFLQTRVLGIQNNGENLEVSFEGSMAPPTRSFDRILIAIGRKPYTEGLRIEDVGIELTPEGYIKIDQQQRTSVSNILAVGDVTGNPMLAHKATHEGKVAAEVVAGWHSTFDPIAIPSVAYTDPEIAWVGLTENHAKLDGVPYEKSIFPWIASGRALGLGRSEGLTKLLFDPNDKRILGAGIVGVHAGDLISEACLGVEMGCNAQDFSLTIHPHPTFSETIGLAAEITAGTITDLYAPQVERTN